MHRQLDATDFQLSAGERLQGHGWMHRRIQWYLLPDHKVPICEVRLVLVIALRRPLFVLVPITMLA